MLQLVQKVSVFSVAEYLENEIIRYDRKCLLCWLWVYVKSLCSKQKEVFKNHDVNPILIGMLVSVLSLIGKEITMHRIAYVFRC